MGVGEGYCAVEMADRRPLASYSVQGRLDGQGRMSIVPRVGFD